MVEHCPTFVLLPILFWNVSWVAADGMNNIAANITTCQNNNRFDVVYHNAHNDVKSA